MEHFIKENWFKISVLFFLAITAFSAVWYYLTLKPQQDQAALQQKTAAQSDSEIQVANKTQQLQNCIDKAKQDFANSYADLCTYYQTNQHQLDNPNWQCPLATMAGYSGSPYPAMVSKEQSDEELCATLYK